MRFRQKTGGSAQYLLSSSARIYGTRSWGRHSGSLATPQHSEIQRGAGVGTGGRGREEEEEEESEEGGMTRVMPRYLPGETKVGNVRKTKQDESKQKLMSCGG